MTNKIAIAESWKLVLREEMDKPYFKELVLFLKQQQAAGKTTFPPDPQIFSAFDYTSFNDTRVVIIGQDPYHGTMQAHGLCFSVNNGDQIYHY